MTEQKFCEAAGSYQRLLYHVAYTILRDNRECEDAVQEALCRAWQKRDTLREESAFRFWLVKILTNQCHSMLRKRRAVTTELSDTLSAPHEDILQNQALHNAIGQLPGEIRLAIILYYMEGFSIKEIAALSHRPEGTVRNRLFRGRQQLKELLGEEMEE